MLTEKLVTVCVAVLVDPMVMVGIALEIEVGVTAIEVATAVAVGATEVLGVLVQTIPIEAALVMSPPGDVAVPVHDEYRGLLPAGTPFSSVPRAEFYRQALLPDTTLAIATGEVRRFANLLLTIGVVREGTP